MKGNMLNLQAKEKPPTYSRIYNTGKRNGIKKTELKYQQIIKTIEDMYNELHAKHETLKQKMKSAKVLLGN